ncbi:2-keto-3-deoxygluconate kinase [Lactococcus hodotermopsidis]|uniref:2-keto-3-deoxygluconate kinase n=1 Tax=Pseudolactococcus hodotermopsidis TaxID=2709157 RepID=A0A6A0BCN2_9LACT|nr:sugar kinase [Lactococcus hodotermopsidis]GFH43142.1 2-keto-3-deoxygluconate kinase [Lactococcus hodotermopsidis]
MRILAFGEVMLRLSPQHYKMIDQTDTLDMSYSGTGLNILSGLARNGVQTQLLSVLPDNPVGRAAAATIRRLGVRDDNLIFDGHHIGTYFLEMGYGNRPSQVTYLNRSESAFCQTEISESQMKSALLASDLVHICGISLCTSKTARDNAMRLAKLTTELSIPLCFDFNYRMSLVKPDERDSLIEDYKTILKEATIVIGGKKDLTLLLEMPYDAENEPIETLYQRFVAAYDLAYFCGTEKSTDHQAKFVRGFLVDKSQVVFSSHRAVTTYDRIGTGDAFASGIIQGLIEQWSLKEIVEFATTSTQLAHTTYGDSPILTKKFIQEKMNDDDLEVIR